jgi:hypothetical protein
MGFIRLEKEAGAFDSKSHRIVCVRVLLEGEVVVTAWHLFIATSQTFNGRRGNQKPDTEVRKETRRNDHTYTDQKRFADMY